MFINDNRLKLTKEVKLTISGYIFLFCISAVVCILNPIHSFWDNVFGCIILIEAIIFIALLMINLFFRWLDWINDYDYFDSKVHLKVILDTKLLTVDVDRNERCSKFVSDLLIKHKRHLDKDWQFLDSTGYIIDQNLTMFEVFRDYKQPFYLILKPGFGS